MKSICSSLLILMLAWACLLSTVHSARSPDQQEQGGGGDNNAKQNVRRAPAQRPVRRQMGVELYKSKECRDDLFKYCPMARENELNDLAVMQCFYDQVADLSVLDEECQHVSCVVPFSLGRGVKI